MEILPIENAIKKIPNRILVFAPKTDLPKLRDLGVHPKPVIHIESKRDVFQKPEEIIARMDNNIDWAQKIKEANKKFFNL